MADLFGGLGGLMKGLSSFMPQDDPNTQLFQLQTEVSDLKKQETDLYTEIGRQAAARYGLESFGEAARRMGLIRANLADAEGRLAAAQREKEARESADQAARAQHTCPKCGHENPQGTRFCQECGAKLGEKNLCPSCGQENPLGTRFCGGCGSRLEVGEPC